LRGIGKTQPSLALGRATAGEEKDGGAIFSQGNIALCFLREKIGICLEIRY